MPSADELDATDVDLITLLQADSRRTSAEMAVHVGLSPTAVTRRISRLMSAGVITGFTATVDYGRLGWPIEAFVEVRFVGKTRPEEMDRTVARLPEVVAVFTTSGSYDALVWVRVRDVPHLTEVIDALRASRPVTDTRTHIILASSAAGGAHLISRRDDPDLSR